MITWFKRLSVYAAIVVSSNFCRHWQCGSNAVQCGTI